MEEMIKELVIKYQHNGSVLMNVFEFADSIDKVCRAQRNACFSAYYDHIHDTSELIIAEILTAEITKEDYDNL